MKQPNFPFLICIFSFFIFLFLFSGCNPDLPQTTFDAKGPVAESQLNLFNIIFWAVVVIFVIVQGVLLFTIIKYRAKKGAPRPKQIHGHKVLEITWTIVPAILLVGIAIPTLIVLFMTARTPGADALTVEVIAHQWWWQFEYPELGVSTSNEMHIPVGRDIDIVLISEDVIHSFWVPKLAGKLDIVPTRTNRMWLRADEPGVYYGQCAEFCGVAHALMKFHVVADQPEDFAKWVEHEKSDASSPSSQSAQTGSQLFLSKGCIACHTIQGNPAAAGILGPNLTHIANRQFLASGIIENTKNNLTKWLKDPNAVKPGNKMATIAPVYNNPDMQLTDANIKDLVAYLNSLK